MHSSIGEVNIEEPIGKTINLLIKVARGGTGFVKKLAVLNWLSVKDVKDRLQRELGLQVSRQRLFYRGNELRNKYSLATCGIFSDECVLDLAIAPEPGDSLTPLCRTTGLECPKSLKQHIEQAERALEINIVPELAMEGTGGTYFMKNPKRRVVGCFKPQDEEPFAPNNPRGFVNNVLHGKETEGLQLGMRPGVRAGEACIREVAAFLLDRGRFAGVPATTLVVAQHSSFRYTDGSIQPKIGSFQEFVDHDECVGDIAPSKLPVREVHKIALLDLRLLNGDRNDANLLVRRRRRTVAESDSVAEGQDPVWEIKLIPIDHGYCLPDKIEIAWCDLCWLEWPQLKVPLDAETKRYCLKLDPDVEVARLKTKLDFRTPCLHNLRAAIALVVQGVKSNLNLYQIANLVVRQDLDVPSPFETLLLRSHELTVLAFQNARLLNLNKPSSQPIRIPFNKENKLRTVSEDVRNGSFSSRSFQFHSAESPPLESPLESPPLREPCMEQFLHNMSNGYAPQHGFTPVQMLSKLAQATIDCDSSKSSPERKGKFWVTPMSKADAEIRDSKDSRVEEWTESSESEEISISSGICTPLDISACSSPINGGAEFSGANWIVSSTNQKSKSFFETERKLVRVNSYSGFASPEMFAPPILMKADTSLLRKRKKETREIFR